MSADDPLVRLSDVRRAVAESVAAWGGPGESVGLDVATALRATAAPGNRSASESESPERAYPLLADLIADPDLLRPPQPVLPRHAWRARATLLAAPDKSGKSTLAAHGVAALTTGRPWLGESLAVGVAVVVAPDEAVGDTVRRLQEAGADSTRVRVLVLRPPSILESLTKLLDEHPADLVVVDSLAEYARLQAGTAPDDGDAAGWGAIVRPLVQLARDFDVAVLILHHPRRSDGQYRGSGEIAAAVDALIEMTMPQAGEDPTLRRLRGRARWPVEDHAVRMEGGHFVLGGGGEVPVDARILLDVREHPGTSRSAQHRRLGGRRQTYLAAVSRLLERGGLMERGGGLYGPDDVEADAL